MLPHICILWKKKIDYPQTVWLDDDGNRLPTYVNETDYGSNCDNGTLASETWFPRRHYNLTVKTFTASGSEISDVKMWLDGGLNYSPIIAHDVTAETHNVEVEPTICLDGCEYRFLRWEDNSTSNPRRLHIHDNKTITAYYYTQLNLRIQTRTLGETEIEGVQVWVDDSYYLSPVNVTIDEGNHKIEVPSIFFRSGPQPGTTWKYTFKHWENGSTANPRNLFLNENTTITAYYRKKLEWWGPLNTQS